MNDGGSSGGGDATADGPADFRSGASDYNPNRADNRKAPSSGPTAAQTKAAADKKKKAEEELKKKEAATKEDEKKKKEREKRSLLTGYDDPKIKRRKLLRTSDGGTIGENTGDQLI